MKKRSEPAQEKNYLPTLHRDPITGADLAEDDAAGAGGEGFVDVSGGDDGDPADAHVEGVVAVLGIDAGEDFLADGVFPGGNLEVRAETLEEAFEVLGETAAGDVGHRFRAHSGVTDVFDDIKVETGGSEHFALFFGGEVAGTRGEHFAHEAEAIGVKAIGTVTDEDVALCYRGGVDEVGLFDRTDTEAGELDDVFGNDARHLGRFAAREDTAAFL